MDRAGGGPLVSMTQIPKKAKQGTANSHLERKTLSRFGGGSLGFLFMAFSFRAITNTHEVSYHCSFESLYTFVKIFNGQVVRFKQCYDKI